MTVARAGASAVTVTERLITLARRRADHTALIGVPGRSGRLAPPLSYSRFATTIEQAAAGLAWHGLRSGDVVGVQVDDAASFTLAVHSIRAADGIPSPVGAGADAAAVARQLAHCGARMLLTTPALAATALQAADRSWVRQVISFGDAPGAIAFRSLLQRGSARPGGSGSAELALLPYARAAVGRLTPVAFTHSNHTSELARLAAAGVSQHDVVIAAPPTGDGRAYTVLVDLVLIQGATVVAATAGEVVETAGTHGGTAAIMSSGTSLALRTLPLTTGEGGSHTAC